METFSVLICTYNRHELLKLALDALIRGTTEKPDQVIVVNGGDEQADRVVETFSGKHGIQVELLRTKNKNLAASRNLGLAHCTGDIIAMTDDDAVVFQDWVTRMKHAHHAHQEAGAVGGLVLGTNSDSLIGKVSDLITFPSWPEPRYVRTLPGVNISYKRTVVAQIGLQDEQLFRGEDVDYNWRLQKLGYQVYFDPSIKVYHYHRPNLRGLLNQHFMYGRAYYLVRSKWPEMYCVYPHSLQRPRDILKAVNFIAAIFYEPFQALERMDRTSGRAFAYSILLANQVAWRSGMVREALWLKSSRTHARPGRAPRHAETTRRSS